jgi:hypothetical protein
LPITDKTQAICTVIYISTRLDKPGERLAREPKAIPPALCCISFVLSLESLWVGHRPPREMSGSRLPLDWEQYRTVIEELYMTLDFTLQDVVDEMKHVHGFIARSDNHASEAYLLMIALQPPAIRETTEVVEMQQK